MQREDLQDAITAVERKVSWMIVSHQRLYDFVESLLDPEENGWAVQPHIRDEARKALGRKPVETSNG